MRTVTYTPPQFRSLRALAHAYGHGWATASGMPADHPIADCLWTQALVGELYAALVARDRLEPWQCGIPDPGHTNGSGAVCHTTGSGRLTWRVDPYGDVGFVIERPAPDRGESRHGVVVLSALVRDGVIVGVRTPDTRENRIPDVYTATWSADDGPRAEARHGDELLYALSALVEPGAARAALEVAGVPLTPDALGGYSPDEIVVGAGGETLADAAIAEGLPCTT
jgi:hypothetical protein